MTAAQSKPTYAMIAAVNRADPWLSVPDVAALTGLSRMTIYRATQGYFLQAVRRGRSIRIRTSWYREWIEAGARTYEEKP